MANNAFINKVIYSGSTLIDLTADTAIAADVQTGKWFHLKTGERIQGTNNWDANTQSGNALPAEILSGQKAWVKGSEVTGTMPVVGATTLIISTTSQITIPLGYHDGSGKVGINSTELNKLISSNIKNGVTILGVEGTLTGSEMVSVTTKTVTPTTSVQVYTPPTGIDYFSQFTVNAIPYTEADNDDGGRTVTIAGN